MLMDLANAGPKLTPARFYIWCTPSLFTEGAFRRRSVAERGWRRLQAGFATSSQEARSPSGPDEGPAFGGWTRSDEGRRKCRLDHASGEKPSGPIKKYGDRVKNRRGGAPEGAPAGLGRRAPSTSAQCTCAPSALRLPREANGRAKARKQDRTG
jgi:hypothetical protein